jgi:hypothetical protein
VLCFITLNVICAQSSVMCSGENVHHNSDVCVCVYCGQNSVMSSGENVQHNSDVCVCVYCAQKAQLCVLVRMCTITLMCVCVCVCVYCAHSSVMCSGENVQP